MMNRPTALRPAAVSAALFATPLAAQAGTALAGQADVAVQIAERAPHRFMRGRVCEFRGVRIPALIVRRNARAASYRRIRNIRFVSRRHGRHHWCGFYRAEATLEGRPFVIFADSHTGRVITRHCQGRIGQSYRPNMSVAKVRSTLRRHGYRRVRDVRYVRRGGRDFYLARAHRRGWVMRLRIDDETGRVVDRQRLQRSSLERASPALSASEVSALLRAKGYRDIRVVHYRQAAEAAGYEAIASYDSVPYRLQISATTGKVKAKRRLR